MNKPSVKTIKHNAELFDIPYESAVKKKKQYICGLMEELRKRINGQKQMLEQSKNYDEQGLLKYRIELLEKQFTGHKKYLAYLNNPELDEEVITDEEIEIARNYLVQEFLPEHFRGKENISCLIPGHEDKHASMQVNLTSVFCHTCKKKLDAIDLTMMYKGLDFKSTVRLLARS